MYINRWVMLAGIALVGLFAGVLLHYDVGSPDWLPRCLDRGLIAIETAVTPDELRSTWRQPGFRQQNLVPNLKWDFGFMAAYGAVFLMLAFVARWRGGRIVRFAAVG